MVSPLPWSLLQIAARSVVPDFVTRCMSHELLWKAMVITSMTFSEQLGEKERNKGRKDHRIA